MSWAAYLVQTMTGLRGKRLDIAADGSWGIPINGIEDWTVKVAKDELRSLDPLWWSPWRTSVLLCWVREDGTEVPWIMGPITQPPAEDRHTAVLTCRGLGALLERRVILARDYGQDPDYSRDSDMVWLAKSVVNLQGMSLGTIAQEYVRLSTTAKLGGWLPISYGSPREAGSTLNERNLEGWNLANNGTWKRLTELAEVRNGPDIAFRPAWADEAHTRVQWVMVHGTRAQPAIAQEWTMDLDTTSSESPVASVNVTTDASTLNSRVYWTGAGEGAGTLIRMAQEESRLQDHMPLLEVVGSTSDSDNPALIQEHADAALAAGEGALQQLTVRIDGSDQRCEIGRWRVGDTANVTIGTDWLTVRPGTRPMKVIAAKGSWSSTMVDLEFQEVRA